MRLNKKEKELIKDFFDSDLDIEIIRKRYTAILVSNVYYTHKPTTVRHRGDKRGLEIYTKRCGIDTIVSYELEEAFTTPKEAIEFLGRYTV